MSKDVLANESVSKLNSQAPLDNNSPNTNNFNFLRLLLATLVILSHSPELVDGNRSREILTQIFHTVSFGEFAVDGFFILSGYLIIQSWQRDPRLFNFLKKRMLRIYPGFIVASLISAFVFGPLGSQPDKYFSKFSYFSFLKDMSFLRVPNVPAVFAGTPYAILNGSLWTIQYEFICYSLIALFGVFGLVKNRIFLLFCFLGTLIIRSIIIWGYDLLLPFRDFETILLINSHTLLKFISFFFAGSCFYLFRDKFSFSKRNVLIAAAVVMVNLFWDKSAEILLSTVGAYLLLYFAVTNFSVFQRFSKWADISYGVYLYAWPIQKLFLWNYPSLSPWLLFMLTFGCSYACGFLSWHLVEQPFLRLKRKTVVKAVTE